MLWDTISVTFAILLTNMLLSYQWHFRTLNVEERLNPLKWIPSIGYPIQDDFAKGYYTSVLAFIGISIAVLLLINLVFGNYNSALKHFGMGEVARCIFAVITFGVILYCANHFLLDSPMHEGLEIQFSLLIIAIILSLELLGRSSVRAINEIHARINAITVRKSGEQVRTLIFGAGEAGAYFCAKHKKDLYT